MYGYKYWSAWMMHVLLKYGLTKSEIRYVINRVSNAVRRRDDGCLHNFRISVNHMRDQEYEEIRWPMAAYDETIHLRSGKTVEFGFNGSD